MMECAFTPLQFDRQRLELFFLLVAEHRLDGIHVAGQPGNRQQFPAMAAGMYCKQPLSRVASSRPIQQVRWAIGCVRVQYE